MSRNGLVPGLVFVVLASLAAAPGAQAKPILKQRAAQVPAVEGKAIAVMCPRGARVTGGGLHHDAPAELFMRSSGPVDKRGRRDRDRVTDDGWRVVVDNYDLTQSSARAFAICVGGKAAQGLKYANRAESVNAGSSVLTAPCPGASRVTGGGNVVTNVGFGEAAVSSTQPIDGGDSQSVPDDGWSSRVSVQNQGALTIRVVCATKKFARGLSYVTDSASIGPSGSGFAAAQCAPGRFALGGGIDTGQAANVTTNSPSDGPDAGLLADDEWEAYAYAPGGPAQLEVTGICHR